jgi:type IV pilus assembly protein PilW
MEMKNMRNLARGFTLTELMIALVLSAFLVAGIGSVYVANVRTSQVNNFMSQNQQASQISFQLITRDAQHAGFTGCGNMISERVVNALRIDASHWWAHWNQFGGVTIYSGLQGYESAASAVPSFGGAGISPKTGSDAVRMMHGRGTSASVVSHNLAANPPLVINQNLARIATNDIVIGCDSKMAVIFQVTDISGNNIRHAIGAGSPGNNHNNFGFGANGTNIPQSLTPDAGIIVPLESVAWFVGTENGVSSLYRVALIAGSMRNEVILSDVDDMELQYLQLGNPNYVNANAVTAWEEVVAIRVTLVMANNTDNPVAENLRTISQVINLRNH